MSTYKINVDELTRIVAKGYKEVLEHSLQVAIKNNIDAIVDEAVKKLAKQIDASVNSYYHVEKNNIIVEMYIDKSKIEY